MNDEQAILTRINDLMKNRHLQHDNKLETKISDTDMNSLDQIEILMDIEDEWDLEIDDDSAEKFKTFQDVVNFVSTKVSYGRS